jgi:phosphate transport system ATP-binding protein
MNTPPKIIVDDLTFHYGEHRIFDRIRVTFAERSITAVTGPSGKGKSSFLTVINRLWEAVPDARVRGAVRIRFDGDFEDIMAGHYSLPRLRRKVGMVFQMPNPLPMSILKNMAFPLKLAGIGDKRKWVEAAETALRRTRLWDEVKDRLHADGRSLSGGQQQRLCMARALILEPDILLLDEPTSSLDARAAEGIEDLMLELKDRCTLIVVSHYLDQVNRIADRVLALEAGRFVESGPRNRS